MTADLGDMLQGKLLHATMDCKQYRTTSKNSTECQRFIANMKKQEDRHYDYKAVQFGQMTHIFVMSLTFQYNTNVLLSKQFGTKPGVGLIDPTQFVATTGIGMSVFLLLHTLWVFSRLWMCFGVFNFVRNRTLYVRCVSTPVIHNN